MWPYWLIFLIPAVLALLEPRPHPAAGATHVATGSLVGWAGVWLALSMLIGLRHEVGGDWANYLDIFYRDEGQTLGEAIAASDPGYRVLEWITEQLGWDIHGLNLLAAMVFSYGLVVFCRQLPRPWLALTVSIPYVVIIMGMGYSRQGIALGCVMVSLVALSHKRTFRFVFWAILGATFHKSAVLLLPVAALAASKRKMVTAAWVAVVAGVTFSLLLQDSVEGLQANYIGAEYQSQGALVRLALNALPAAILLMWRGRFAMNQEQQRLWFWFAVSAFIFLVLYYVSPSSTAVDRMGLYLLPLQLVVFSYVPDVIERGSRNNAMGVALVIALYAAVQGVWLNYATNAYAWIPYRMYTPGDAT